MNKFRSVMVSIVVVPSIIGLWLLGIAILKWQIFDLYEHRPWKETTNNEFIVDPLFADPDVMFSIVDEDDSMIFEITSQSEMFWGEGKTKSDMTRVLHNQGMHWYQYKSVDPENKECGRSGYPPCISTPSK